MYIQSPILLTEVYGNTPAQQEERLADVSPVMALAVARDSAMGDPTKPRVIPKVGHINKKKLGYC